MSEEVVVKAAEETGEGQPMSAGQIMLAERRAERHAIDRQDIVDNAIFECLSTILNNPNFELEWDSETISELRDAAMTIIEAHGLGKESELYPVPPDIEN